MAANPDDYTTTLYVTNSSGNSISGCSITTSAFESNCWGESSPGAYTLTSREASTNFTISKSGYKTTTYEVDFTSSEKLTVVLEREPTIQSEIDRIKEAKANIISNVNTYLGGGVELISPTTGSIDDIAGQINSKIFLPANTAMIIWPEACGTSRITSSLSDYTLTLTLSQDTTSKNYSSMCYKFIQKTGNEFYWLKLDNTLTSGPTLQVTKLYRDSGANFNSVDLSRQPSYGSWLTTDINKGEIILITICETYSGSDSPGPS